MKNYTKPEIKQISVDTRDIMTASSTPSDQVTAIYGSWRDVYKGLEGDGYN